jgi:glycosyltransferase involved in cell wall biosynthesis
MTCTAVPRVAILVACFNDGSTVGETIESLRHERDTELVVVDDGSTDRDTLEILRVLEAKGFLVIRQENSGPSSAWRAGLAVSSAPYVLPFSSDDLLVRGATEQLANALDASPHAAAAWGDMHSFGDANARIPAAPELCPWLVTYVNCLPGIALFRRSALVDVGAWQLTRGIEDWDLWMRLAAAGHRGIHVPALIFHYRRDAGGRFRGRVKMFDAFYEQLRRRNAPLFARRDATRRESRSPIALKLSVRIIDRLPFVSRLVKVQLCELLTLLFWSAGLRATTRIVVQGLLFRARLPGSDRRPLRLRRRD